jgi:hypothetical protein
MSSVSRRKEIAMEIPPDKNEALLQGYLDWCNTERAEWEGNLVGQVIADGVVLVDVERNERVEGKDPVLAKLDSLKSTTTVDPLSVRVGTTEEGNGNESFGCDWELMTDREHKGWHTCFDRFEWDAAGKISAIFVCTADDHSLHAHSH